LSTHPGGSETGQVNPTSNSTQNGHTCSTCFKWFKYLSDFKRHLVVHTGEKPFECPACPYRVGQYHNLKKHMHRMHPDMLYIPKTYKDFQTNYRGNE